MAIDFKTLTPDTSFGSGAFLFGADSQAASTPSIYGVDDVFGYLLTLSNIWTNQQTFTNPITVGNSTVNTVISSTSVTVANSTTSIALSNPTSGEITAGSYYLNANGSWSEVNLETFDNPITVGNGTVNTVISSTSVTVANSTTSIALSNPTSGEITAGSYYLNANGSWSEVNLETFTNPITVGNGTVNTVISSTSVTVANSTTSIALSNPTSAAISSGNYYLNANGSWSEVNLDTVNVTNTSFSVIQSVTGDNAASAINVTPTWNTTGTPTAIKLNVTDTASNASSLLMDLQVESSSKFSVSKSGVVTLPGVLINTTGKIDITGADGAINDTSGRLDLRAGSITYAAVRSNGLWVRSDGYYSFGTSTNPITAGDVYLYRDAADTLALRRSTNPQAFNIYNTYTDASNYERGFLKWNSDIFEIGTEASGTGSARLLKLTSPTEVSANVGINGANTTNFALTVNGSFGVISNTDTVFSVNNATSGTLLEVINSSNTTVFSIDANTSGTLLEVVNLSNTTVFSVTDEGSVTVDGTTATANDSVFLDLGQTWDAGANTVSGLKLNVTDTASSSSSKLIDLQVGGTSQFSVKKDGTLTTGTGFGEVYFGGTGGNVSFRYFKISETAGGITSIYYGTNPYLTVRGASNVVGISGNISLAFTSGSSSASGWDAYINRDAADTIALKRSTNAQTFRIYNTYTDASNYERAAFTWDTNVFKLNMEAAGTGSNRYFSITGPSLTGAEALSALDITQTWNTTGEPAAINVNITDTASGLFSDFFRGQVGGSTKIKITSDAKIIGNGYGLFLNTSGQVSFFYMLGTLGYERARLDSSGNFKVISTGSYRFSSTSNLGSTGLLLARDADNIFAQRLGTNAQTYRIYNTYTDDSNYERLAISWGSNILDIAPEAAGTGTKRPMRFTYYGEGLNTIADAAASQSIDLRSGNVVDVTVNSNAPTFTFDNPIATGSAHSFTMIIRDGGSQTVTWPASVDWAGGTAPTLTASGVDVLTFTTVDGGTTWYGFAAGLEMQ